MINQISSILVGIPGTTSTGDSIFHETYFGLQHVPSIRKAYNLAGAMKS